MNADLERVIALQRLDSEANAARKKLAEAPEREKAFDARLEAAQHNVAEAKARLAANQEARRAIEKEVAVHQGRLSKYRDQAMAVKTNQEYHAIQHEITHAQGEVKRYEDQILERMVEADDLAATIKAAESALATEQKTIDADRKRMQAEDVALQKTADALSAERATVVAALDKRVLAIYETAATRRQGIAVAEAKDGICTICHVRLRPQVFNEIRRNDAIRQCDSCQRILYSWFPRRRRSPRNRLDHRVHRRRGSRQSGPAGYGVHIVDADGCVLDELHGGLGVATNNVAEYNGLLAALRWAKEHGHTTLHIKADSLLLVEQMRGNYKVKQPRDCSPCMPGHACSPTKWGRVSFEHVRREFNKDADSSVESGHGRGGTSAAKPDRPEGLPFAVSRACDSDSPSHVSWR
jgi:predicted  nucleic acid-binding Zn-ribbon protein/ribonuclease HI